MAKKPKGFGKFDKLMRKLVKVPPEELKQRPKRQKRTGKRVPGRSDLFPEM